ncbi:MAG: ATP-binding protein [Candidatus Margulisbacteria bacterium]|jgi:predicted AAA+ superfamily ATPase|nr:ATP-binding protein [Candidatus Margulisiibacteriota bacterium]
MLPRNIISTAEKYKKLFPVLAVTGPRQSGKTTFLKTYFKNYKYFNLENIETYRLFTEDPAAFINSKQAKIIIDEVQRVPELLSYIQAVVDEQKIMGSYIVSGSENLLLSAKIAQSLTGRAAYLTLPPLVNSEIAQSKLPLKNLYAKIFTGGYPAIFDRRLNPTVYYEEYTSTYIERDVRQIKNVSNLRLFRKFVRLLAGRIAQPFNASSLANDIGVTSTTIKDWLSILEATYIIFALEPWHKNIGKQLTKMPKIYFYDTGLLCYLLDLKNARELETHYLIGSIFENFIIADIKKELLNRKSPDYLYFFREKNGHEIDLLLKRGQKLIPVEIKKGGTFASDFTKGLKYWNSLKITAPSSQAAVIYTGHTETQTSTYRLLNWRQATEALL